MKNKICHISLIALIALFCWACEENVLQPLSQGEKPGPITSYSVESLPGGAQPTVRPGEELSTYASDLRAICDAGALFLARGIHREGPRRGSAFPGRRSRGGKTSPVRHSRPPCSAG